MGGHRFEAVGSRHPEVGRDADIGSREEVHILHHIGVAHLEREIVGDEPPGRDAGLWSAIERVLHLEAAEMEAVVEFDIIVDSPLILAEKDNFVGRNHGSVDGGVEL